MEKVSCLMVTFMEAGASRLELFKKSFDCYCRQTHSSKELVIVACGDDDYVGQVRKHLAGSQRDDVRILLPNVMMPLGALRNMAMDHATGDIVCQWDDDDINHPTRLSRQLDTMRQSKAQASFLLDYLHLFYDTRRIFWSDWRRLPLSDEPGLPGTLLAYKDVLPRYNDKLSRDEDSTIQRALCKNGILTAVIGGLGPLYIYTFHGTNIFSRAHHEYTARFTALEWATLTGRAASLFSALYDYDLNPPLYVVDNYGRTVFEWSGEASLPEGFLGKHLEPSSHVFMVRSHSSSSENLITGNSQSI
jgi:glycosyltransferase involved in cell wall biosynthesis